MRLRWANHLAYIECFFTDHRNGAIDSHSNCNTHAQSEVWHQCFQQNSGLLLHSGSCILEKLHFRGPIVFCRSLACILQRFQALSVYIGYSEGISVLTQIFFSCIIFLHFQVKPCETVQFATAKTCYCCYWSWNMTLCSSTFQDSRFKTQDSFVISAIFVTHTEDWNCNIQGPTALRYISSIKTGTI